MQKFRLKSIIGLSFLLFFLLLIPSSHSQSYYQTYFWITETGTQLSAIQTTGDLDSDHVQLSEIAVSGAGNITLLDGLAGTILANYNVSPTIIYNTLATGNLDTDSSKEIVAGSQNAGILTALKYNTSTDKLDLMWEENYNVTHVEIANISGDYINEVIIGDVFGNLTVLYNNGTLLWSYNLTQSISNFKCVDITQDNIIDGIIVLTDNLVTFLNNTGVQWWQVGVSSKPMNVIVGDVMGTAELEIVLKGQQTTNALAPNGTFLWNSSAYSSDSTAIILYNYVGSSKLEILIGINNGSFFMNGSDGTILKSYFSQSIVNSLAISNFFAETTNYLMMGDTAKNITLWALDGTFYYNITLSGPVLDLLLIDMNADGLLDIVTASLNGTVYVIGLPWVIDLTWVAIGIGISCAIIAISIIIVYKKKPKPAPKLPLMQ